jgi:hypothetical protein
MRCLVECSVLELRLPGAHFEKLKEIFQSFEKIIITISAYVQRYSTSI